MTCSMTIMTSMVGRRSWPAVYAVSEYEAAGETASQMAAVFVVEDHALVREGICQLVTQDPNLCIAGEAGSFDEAVEGIASSNPDVILIDISLAGRKDQSGIDLIEHLKKSGSQAKMIVVTGHSTSYYANAAIKRGAHGFVAKDEVFSRLLPAIRTVMEGGSYISATKY